MERLARPRSRSGAGRWLGRFVLIAIVALLAVGAIQWRAVLNSFGELLVSHQTPQPADLILVLGGDFWGPRVIKGADLGMQGFAPQVLISGPPYQGRPESNLAIQFLVARGYPMRLFQGFPIRAPSTIAEAVALRPELERRGVKRVLLVTSAYHSRRAKIVFSLYCPGIRFLAIGAPDEHYHAENWWEDASSREYFGSEWSKIFGTILWEYPKYRVEAFLHLGGQK